MIQRVRFAMMELFMDIWTELAMHHEIRRARYINNCRKVALENKI